MDTARAFMRGELARKSGAKQMVFDWDKAAEIIKNRRPLKASAGLLHDYEWTAGEIYSHGMIIKDSYTYLSSNWATPMLILGDYEEEIPCFKMEDETTWDEKTKWPESAVTILEG